MTKPSVPMIARLLALALPWLIMVFAVFSYGVREGYAKGVFAGVVAPLVINLYLLPLPVVRRRIN